VIIALSVESQEVTVRSPVPSRFKSGLCLLAASGVLLATSALAEERKPPLPKPPPPKPSWHPTLLSGSPVKVTGMITHNFVMQRQGSDGSPNPTPSRGGQRR
jgi:hypothetical protein